METSSTQASTEDHGLSDASRVQELIERLEKADGPDRELDARIAAWRHGGSLPNEIRYETSSRGFFLFGDGDLCPAREYTASIDAAMTLVPEGWRSAVVGEGPDGNWFWALHSNERARQVHSATPFHRVDKAMPAAIALCIAALKARIHP